MQKITLNHPVKTPLTPEQKDNLLKECTEADALITKVNEELDAHKETVKGIIKEQDMKISSAYAVYRKGYTTKLVECTVTYKDGEVTFVDKEGVIVDQRAITEEEQLMLSENRVDAEVIIRADRQRQDSEESEGEE